MFGGSFNPVHIGHLIAAQDALELFDLSRVVFVPCRLPPHKEGTHLADAAHRAAMLEAAIEDDLRFELSRVELLRDGPSYTVDTIRELKRQQPEAQIHFIMGSDMLPELHLWRDVYRLLEMCRFITLCRPPTDPRSLSAASIGLTPPWPERILELAAAGRMVAVSSSEVRHRIAEGLSIRYLVPAAVEMYIAEHRLYEA